MKYFPLIIVSVLAGCETPVPESPPPRPALVMTVASRASAESMTFVGEVAPRYESSQAFRINGKIVERRVEVGSSVKKGQVLARLDPRDPQLAVLATQADVKAAEASLSLAVAEVARYRQLARRKFVSASALDVKEAELKTARAKLAQLEAQADVSGNQAAYAQLKADRNGVVTLIRAEPGQVVEAGELIAKIAGTDEIEVRVSLPESRISQVKQGDTVRIRLWANPSRIYAGMVREIAPAGDPQTRTFSLRVAIKDWDSSVQLGMTARVAFDRQSGAETDTGILIPSTAATELDGKKIVWLIDKDNKAQPREVSLGAFGEYGVPVLNGLAVGDRIAVAGVHTLIEGQTVRPVTAEP